MENSATPSSQPQPPVRTNIRLKTYIAWRHGSEGVDERGKKVITCLFCAKVLHDGGINRLKQHLAGAKGSVHACPKVTVEVRCQMQGALQENAQKAKEKRNAMSDSSQTEVHDLDGDVDLGRSNSNLGKRKVSLVFHNLQSHFKFGLNDPSQPSIVAAFQSKEMWHDTDLALAMWFYEACIPLNAINSPFFQIAMSKVAMMGHGYTGPTYHALRVTLLKDAKTSVKLIVDQHRQYWAESGCTIMGDGWRDTRQRPLINFLVYCVKGVSFIRSVDASDFETSAVNLCNLFAEIVEIVGPQNVVHVVTDNAANYKLAGKFLCEKYPTICWSPCAAHCINLIMKDIAELPHVDNVVTLATRISVFLYNHKWPLNWLRKRPNWTEIIRPGNTRFGTTFIALKSLHHHKADLQAFATSHDYQNCLKYPKGKDVKLIILDERFWNNCLIIVKIMGPLLRLLRICDSDEHPALGYVYEGMHRAKKGIKKLFRHQKDYYKMYTGIIKKRWDKMLRKSLHAAAYWLNPVFQYDKDSFCNKNEVFNGVLDMIEKTATSDTVTLTFDLNKFRERVDSFGRDVAYASRKGHRPDEWWKLFGGDVPALQKFAIRILSQTASSSGCERNWSVFERIHTKKRNRLEHERLNVLVYVHYNLRLQNRDKRQRNYDPVDYECIDKTDMWIVEEVQEGELAHDEIENMLEEEPPSTGTNVEHVENENNGDGMVDEEIDMTSYARSVVLCVNPC